MTVGFSETAFMSVSELVTIEEGVKHREDYAYFLIIDEKEIWARERDPSHDPPEHGHGPGHVWVEAGPISFVGALEAAWEVVSKEAELSDGR
jgi:hypothetical protein